MMPFFVLYGALTHQVLAHSYLGAQRHAFTVGFISMMILGVSSRVVPILAGVDAKKLDSLWGVFLLFNFGIAARVTLQILTDLVPRAAYPLIGFTGFIEVTALAWWGIGLWRTMNQARTERPKSSPRLSRSSRPSLNPLIARQRTESCQASSATLPVGLAA